MPTFFNPIFPNEEESVARPQVFSPKTTLPEQPIPTQQPQPQQEQSAPQMFDLSLGLPQTPDFVSGNMAKAKARKQLEEKALFNFSKSLNVEDPVERSLLRKEADAKMSEAQYRYPRAINRIEDAETFSQGFDYLLEGTAEMSTTMGNILGESVKGAAIGAPIGTFIPGVGTLSGAGIGAATAAGAYGTALETGDIAQSLRQEGINIDDPRVKAYIQGGGSLAGALELFGLSGVTKAVSNPLRQGVKDTVKGIIKEGAVAAGKSSLYEGGTELAQEAINIGTQRLVKEDYSAPTKDEISQALNAGLIGAFSGGAFGGAGATTTTTLKTLADTHGREKVTKTLADLYKQEYGVEYVERVANSMGYNSFEEALNSPEFIEGFDLAGQDELSAATSELNQFSEGFQIIDPEAAMGERTFNDKMYPSVDLTAQMYPQLAYSESIEDGAVKAQARAEKEGRTTRIVSYLEAINNKLANEGITATSGEAYEDALQMEVDKIVEQKPKTKQAAESMSAREFLDKFNTIEDIDLADSPLTSKELYGTGDTKDARYSSAIIRDPKFSGYIKDSEGNKVPNYKPRFGEIIVEINGKKQALSVMNLIKRSVRRYADEMVSDGVTARVAEALRLGLSDLYGVKGMESIVTDLFNTNAKDKGKSSIFRPQMGTVAFVMKRPDGSKRYVSLYELLANDDTRAEARYKGATAMLKDAQLFMDFAPKQLKHNLENIAQIKRDLKAMEEKAKEIKERGNTDPSYRWDVEIDKLRANYKRLNDRRKALQYENKDLSHQIKLTEARIPQLESDFTAAEIEYNNAKADEMYMPEKVMEEFDVDAVEQLQGREDPTQVTFENMRPIYRPNEENKDVATGGFMEFEDTDRREKRQSEVDISNPELEKVLGFTRYIDKLSTLATGLKDAFYQAVNNQKWGPRYVQLSAEIEAVTNKQAALIRKQNELDARIEQIKKDSNIKGSVYVMDVQNSSPETLAARKYIIDLRRRFDAKHPNIQQKIAIYDAELRTLESQVQDIVNAVREFTNKETGEKFDFKCMTRKEQNRLLDAAATERNTRIVNDFKKEGATAFNSLTESLNKLKDAINDPAANRSFASYLGQLTKIKEGSFTERLSQKVVVLKRIRSRLETIQFDNVKVTKTVVPELNKDGTPVLLPEFKPYEKPVSPATASRKITSKDTRFISALRNYMGLSARDVDTVSKLRFTGFKPAVSELVTYSEYPEFRDFREDLDLLIGLAERTIRAQEMLNSDGQYTGPTPAAVAATYRLFNQAKWAYKVATDQEVDPDLRPTPLNIVKLVEAARHATFEKAKEELRNQRNTRLSYAEQQEATQNQRAAVDKILEDSANRTEDRRSVDAVANPFTEAQLENLNNDSSQMSAIRRKFDKFIKKLTLPEAVHLLTPKQAIEMLEDMGLTDDANQIREGLVNGKRIIYTDPVTGDVQYFVYVDPRQTKVNVEDALAHEIGHTVLDQFFNRLDGKEAQEIMNEYRAYRKSVTNELNGKITFRNLQKLLEMRPEDLMSFKSRGADIYGSMVNNSAEAQAYLEYVTDFHEWFADRVSARLRDTTPARTAFQRMIDNLLTMFHRLFDKDYVREGNVQDFVDALVEHRPLLWGGARMASEALSSWHRINMQDYENDREFNPDDLNAVADFYKSVTNLTMDADTIAMLGMLHGQDRTNALYREIMSDIMTNGNTGISNEARTVLLRFARRPDVRQYLIGNVTNRNFREALIKNDNLLVAYAYQLWATGNLNMDGTAADIKNPKVRKIFLDLSDGLSQTFDYMNELEQADRMFAYIHSGNAALNKQFPHLGGAQNTVARQAWNGYIKPAWDAVYKSRFGGGVFSTASTRLQDTNIPMLIKLGDMLFGRIGKAYTEESFISGKERNMHKFLRRYDQIVKDFTEVELQELGAMLNLGLPVADYEHAYNDKLITALKAMRTLYADVFQYGRKNGVDIGYLDENYSPWSMDLPYLTDHREEFIDLFNEANLRNHLMQHQMDPTRLWETIVNNMGDTHYDEESATKVRPYVSAKKFRSLNWIRTVATPEQMNRFNKFLSDNATQSVHTYIHQMVKRAEFNRVFRDYMDYQGSDPLAYILAEANRQGATKQDLVLAKQYVEAVMGTLGRDTNTALKAFFGMQPPVPGEVIDKRLQKGMATVMTTVNLATLGLATLTSVIDAFGTMIRTQDLQVSYQGFVEAFNAMKAEYNGQESELMAIADAIGTSSRDSSIEVLNQLYGGNYMSGMNLKINDKFFNLIGLNLWTKFTRIAATRTGLLFIKKHMTNPDRNSARWMAELDLTPEDLVTDANGDYVLLSYEQIKETEAKINENAEIMHNLDFQFERDQIEELKQENDALRNQIRSSEKLAKAVNKFVDQSVLRPNAALRPIWGSDPHYMLMFHLKSFMYTFHEVILKRMALEAVHGSLMPAAVGLMMMPAMLASDMLRELIQYGSEEPRWKKDWSWFDHILHSAQRAGLPGSYQTGIDMYKDFKYGGNPVDSLLGPTWQMATSGKPQQFMPGYSVWKHWGESE